MSLAPTLLKERTISVSVGLVATGGLIASMSLGFLTPASATVSFSTDTIPTVMVQTGPIAEPTQAPLSLDGQIPFLERILVIAPALPDSIPDENDLTPTLVWGDHADAGVGLVRMAGLVPAVITDGGQKIFPDVGSVVLAGLLPTASVPAGQDGVALPNRTELVAIGLVPDVLSTFPSDVDVGVLTIVGLIPDLAVRYGWQTVALAGDPGWVDVPTV